MIAMDQHLSLSEGDVCPAVERHGIGLEESPGKGDHDLPDRVNGVFIFVIGDAVRLDVDRPLGDFFVRRREGGRRNQKEKQDKYRTEIFLPTQHGPAPLISRVPPCLHPAGRRPDGIF